MVIGRFQPVHFGHMQIVNEIILDGLIPIIVIGSCNSVDKKKNPLDFEERVALWRLLYPNENIIFVPSNDYKDNREWLDSIVTNCHEYETVLYYHDKPEDSYTYSLGNIEFINSPYTTMFELTSFGMKEVEFVGRTDIHVSAAATDIRTNFEEYKHLLDGRVYRQLKQWGWK